MQKLSIHYLRTFSLMLFSALALSACGGTKVYDSTKTVVYNGSIYQVTDVKQISTTVEGITQDKAVINLKNKDRKFIEKAIEDNEPLFVRMAFQLDQEELVYSASEVESYRDFNKRMSRFEDAGDDIAKLMAEKKTKQLKLR